jgi:hypothetical protein
MVRVITKRDAHKYPLWDLLSGSTLKNGMNALDYFNQLVKVRSVSGQIFQPQSGKVGAMNGSLSVKPQVVARQPDQAALAQAQQSASVGKPEQAGERPRGPGRPPKVTAN